MQEKIKVMKKQIPNSPNYSRKLHPFKNPHRLPTEPMGIPIPTAALDIRPIEHLKASAYRQLCLPLLPFTHARSESINADSQVSK